MTFLTPEMLATASSTRLVTCVSSSLGATPGSVTVTETSGTSMLGKRVIGSFAEAHQAEHDQHDEQQDRRNRVADRPGGKVPVHGLIAPVCLAAHRRHHVAVGDEGAGARNHLLAFGNARHHLDHAVGAGAELHRHAS